MYPDPKKVKDIRLCVRINDYQDELLKGLAIALGEQPSTLARDLLIREALRVAAQLDLSVNKLAA